MHKTNRFPAAVLACLLTAATATAFSQAAPPAPPTPPAPPAMPAAGTQMSPAKTYDRLLSGMEQEFVSAAEAMPEDKYNYAPTQGEFKGVRTFAQQVKHVASSNYYFFGGQEYTDAGSKAITDSIDKLTTKADIVKALKDSFVKAHALVDSMTAENAFVMTSHGTRAGMVAFGLAHLMDHYGQLAVYLRMNGIVPPASRAAM